MSDEYGSDDYFGEVLKVEWLSAMTPMDILKKRKDGWILLSFSHDAKLCCYVYYFVKATYFPHK